MKSLKDASSFIEWISQMADAVANHGLWKIIKGTIALAFALIVLNIALNPEIIFDKFTQYTEQVERENVEYRRSVDPIIRGELKELVYDVNATRACVMEFHNGTSNFSSLGFLYAAMTYEEAREGEPSVANVMYDRGYWFGSINDLAQLDPSLAEGISQSGTKWVAALLLESSRELGFLILSFDSIPDNQQEIGRKIRRVGVSIASKLDYIPNAK